MKIKKIDWSSEKSFYALAQFAFGALLSISKFDFKSNYLIIFHTHSLLMLFYSNFFFHFNKKKEKIAKYFFDVLLIHALFQL